MAASKPTPPLIYAAMLQVARSVGYVQKTGKTSFGERYTYAGEADLIRAIRPAMVEAGVFGPVPTVEALAIMEHAPTRKGHAQFRADMTVCYRFYAADGSHVDCSVAGCGIDSGDKLVAKALTGALKYALRQVFLIETGDDPDDTPSAQQSAPEPTSRQRFAPEPAPEPQTPPHHPSWEDERRAFCARMGVFGGYDYVAAATQGEGWGRPSQWREEQRENLLRRLRTHGSIEALIDHIHQPGDEQPPDGQSTPEEA